MGTNINLGIVTLNVNGLRSKRAELQHFMANLKETYDDLIIMINDTRLNNNVTFNIPGFSLIRADKCTNDSSAGGVAIAIPSSWDVEPVASITASGPGYEAVGVITIPPRSKPIKLLSVYNHPQYHVPLNLLEAFLELKHNNTDLHGVIGGDLNSPHEAFSSRFTNSYGVSLLNAINGLDLIVVENLEPTSYHRGEPNVLDLFLCHPRTQSLIRECYVGETIGSDHLPLIIHFSPETNGNAQQSFTKRFFDKRAFQADMENYLNEFDPICNNKDEVDERLENLTATFKTLKLKHTSERTFRHKRTYLPPEILSWINTRKALLKHLRNSRNITEKAQFSVLYNRANKVVKNLLDEHDKSENEKLISKMQTLKDTSKMWQAYHQFKNKFEPNNALKRPLINEMGEKVFSANSKADLFAKRMEDVHQYPTSPLFNAEFEDEVSSYVQQNEHIFSPKPVPSPEPDDTHELMSEITADAIKKKVQESKKNSAPGEDGISYDLLKNCPQIFFVKLALILNFCMSIGYFPKIWKDAKVTMLQKPNKDHTNPKSYRPISLLPVLGKIFEKLLCDRLISHLDKHDIINKFQAGYRKNRSTQEHIFRLAQQVFNGFKQRKCTIGIFLDVEAAFDAVWTEGLMYKLNQLQLPTNFLRILCSFLKERSLKIQVDETKSRSIPLRAGTPQGSCLSPILFSIYVNDIPFHEMFGCEPSQFADDTCIWSTGLDPKSVGITLQESLTKMEEWCKKWRVKLSPTKTAVVLFTRCYKAHIEKPPLRLFGELLSYSDEATFLGVKFNTSLTWEPQIRMLLSKAQPRLNLIRVMSSLNVNNESSMLLYLYKAIVRPIFEYSSIVHVSTAICHQIKLQQIQNAAVRCILKLPRYTSIELLHDASGLPRLQQHCITFARSRLNNMRQTSPLIEDTLGQFLPLATIQTHKSPLEIILSQN